MGASLGRALSYVGVAVVAFVISGGVARAAPAIDIFRLADGNNATRLAAVDASGNLGVTGTVNVGNLPATQSVTGTVGISAAANTVRLDPTGNAVTVTNLPTDANGNVRVSREGGGNRTVTVFENQALPARQFGPTSAWINTVDCSAIWLYSAAGGSGLSAQMQVSGDGVNAATPMRGSNNDSSTSGFGRIDYFWYPIAGTNSNPFQFGGNGIVSLVAPYVRFAYFNNDQAEVVANGTMLCVH